MKENLLNIDTALLTPRTVVRRFRENEGEALYQLIQRNYSELSEHYPSIPQQVHHPASGEYFVRAELADWLQQRAFGFGIWDKSNASLIGYIAVQQIDWTVPKGRLAFFLDKKSQQKGIMTEILPVLFEFAFGQLQLEKLSLLTAMDNYPAQRLARKCGLLREGDLRSEYRKPSGEVIDLMSFGLARNAYEKA